ncbi:MAG: pantoate--beta-alanine ligase [Nitrospiria bacterium]
MQEPMMTISTIGDLKKKLSEIRQGRSVGFIPTMGALHEGHLSLIRQARQDCDILVASIFVNPLQFGPKEDFSIYPRTLLSDQKMCEQHKVDILWTPTQRELFPTSFQTSIEVQPLSQRWEGATRPGHFKGVATIVAKLLQVVHPEHLYLGQKDYQQFRVVEQMLSDLHFDTTVHLSETIREKDGLALSSRNLRLSPTERKAAPIVFRGLRQAGQMVAKGEKNARDIVAKATSTIQSEPLAQIDYLVLCDPKTLEPIEPLEKTSILLVAVKIGDIRLLDNIFLSPSE